MKVPAAAIALGAIVAFMGCIVDGIVIHMRGVVKVSVLILIRICAVAVTFAFGTAVMIGIANIVITKVVNRVWIKPAAIQN
jgi:hypothetical protein